MAAIVATPMGSTKESYNQSAAAYAEKTASFFHQKEMECFTSTFPPGGKILDLGCGAGRDAKRFSEMGFSVIGIDFSEELLSYAKETAPQAVFQLQDLEDLSNFDPGSFDGVWANASLLHLEKARLPGVLSQIHAALKEGGSFFLSLKQGTGEGIILDDRYGGIPKFFAYYQPEEIASLLQNAGFALDSIGAESSSSGPYQTHPFIQVLARKPAEPAHTAEGTDYGIQGAAAYASNRHGPDGALLLDPYFTPYLLNLEGKTVLDAGCGAAPWAVYAAQNGARVYGIDLQPAMVEKAREAAQKADLESRVEIVQGDVANLPYPSEFFDLALSINVGCNLPSTTEAGGKKIGLGPHAREMARTLKPGGLAIVTAPASLHILFTDGTPLETFLPRIGTSLDIKALSELNGIYRATFVFRDGRLALVSDEDALIPGEEIWRKLPGLAVPNRFHSEAEYLEEFLAAGFAVKRIDRPRLTEKHEGLGDAYLSHPPFIIFCFEKK